MGLTLAAAEWGGEFDGALDDINALFSFPALFWQDVAGGLFAVNRTILIAWFMTLVAMTILVLATRNPQVVPGKLQSVVEMLLEFIRGLASDIIGPKGQRYVPLLTTFFVFILFMNLAKLTPFLMLPPTSRIAFPLFLAGIAWLVYVGAGIKEQGVRPLLQGAGLPARRPQGAVRPADADRAAVEPHPASADADAAALRQHGRRPHPGRHHPGRHPRLPSIHAVRMDGRGCSRSSPPPWCSASNS